MADASHESHMRALRGEDARAARAPTCRTIRWMRASGRNYAPSSDELFRRKGRRIWFFQEVVLVTSICEVI
jgi:hypothetical protein